ncbi:MAG TPA: cbb3-type cytochrome oxidase assembly protein CcoS [Amaricoccus sp.]|uniref:cbb3-type cytochrome oxidase assembly protein CcoS n=1 Tax=Amaricoccus sp. TaxID=1872485 RepID=UPI002BDB1C0F|nr:cbb3-type cytochrome oxidase assembly protein CcoS [Amaricoccus sp.]HMQ91664.1 cbb3-type cytochrome oxidase assembly protein CcoS [Amaricoccus sp.]HMR52233.1 cbb3-type cytochrome oxidase assembly protein CcoS [Amaricoccus sp.]HMT99085.1 cbb3-type cytochrome oxidase assembly protein CcoS [Amaricoccus sp.]
MTALLVLIPVSIGMGAIGLCAFFWALDRGQFEDPEGNAWRVIETSEKKGKPDDQLATHTEDQDAGRL